MEESHEPFEHVADSLKMLVDGVGLIEEEFADGDLEHVYQRLRAGTCMTCESELGEDTVLFVSRRGIVGGYCGGACMQDIAVMGWLQEQFDDIQDGIKFRGGKGDQAPEDGDIT